MKVLNAALRRMIAERFDSLQWRHHGIGALQAYISEDTNPEIRVHVFHPKLVRPGITESGSFHDHRFDLHSTILVGKLKDTQVRLIPAGGAITLKRWEIWNVENARSAGQAANYDGKCEPAGDGQYWADMESRIHEAGSTYTVKRGTFHESSPMGLCVTVCELRDKRGQARLLVPSDAPPVHAFGESHVTPEQQKLILNTAHATLLDFTA